jgi:hypothetical protein
VAFSKPIQAPGAINRILVPAGIVTGRSCQSIAVLDKGREMRSNFIILILKPGVKPVPVGLSSGAAADPFKPAFILSATMTNDTGSPGPPSDKLLKLAGHLGIDPEDAETFATDIIPFLNRRFALLTHAATTNEPVENRIQTILQEELPRVLSNYALDDLKANKSVMLFLVKLLAPELTDLRVKQLVDRQAGQADQRFNVHWIIGFGSPETPIFPRGLFSDLAPRIDSLSVGIYSTFSIARWCSSQVLDSPSNIQRFGI